MSQAKDVLVFYSFAKHKTGYYHQLFDPLKQREAEYGLSLSRGSLKDLQIEIIDNHLHVTESMTGQPLSEFDFVQFELWLKSPEQALAAATYLSRNDVLFNGHEALSVCSTTKIGELVRMADSQVPLPRTFMSSRTVTLEIFRAGGPLSYPFIAKAADAFGGRANYLVHNFIELESALNAHKDKFFVLQEFIPNSFDYRILIMGGSIQFILKRTRTDPNSHLNNTSAGATAEFVPIDVLTPTVIRDALKAAELTLRDDFCGVDLLIDSRTGKHYVLEVNEAPAIQTGEDPERKIGYLLEYMADRAAHGVRSHHA